MYNVSEKNESIRKKFLSFGYGVELIYLMYQTKTIEKSLLYTFFNFAKTRAPRP